MLVFGDADETLVTRPELKRLAAEARRIETLPQNLLRHAALMSLFIDATALGQGLVDAEFVDLGRDADSPRRDAATALALAVAGALVRSRRQSAAEAVPIASAIEALGALDLPSEISVRRTEGYAFYGLYPESYAEAALALGGAPATVIGIRSIGFGLAALVAVASGSQPPISVRPVGPPFSRQLALSTDLRRRLLDLPASERFAIVDEGPGLSGSSFGAVMDTLLEGGVARDRILIFPGHTGTPGHAATPETRARWRRLDRHVVDFDSLYLNPARPDAHLETWFADLVGMPVAPLRELSGGAWRTVAVSSAWPPANPQQERRKFLLTTERGEFLLKFAGLGRWGERTFHRAAKLSEAGFVPEVFAFRHGFILSRWVVGRPVGLTGDRRGIHLDRVASYLGFRVRAFATPDAPGADLPELAAMLRQNGLEALGPQAADALDRFAVPPPGARLNRIGTDNRLQAWEWLETPDGRLLKTDAVDHCAAHDLVGHQDIAWDIAGAIVELDLSSTEQDRLIRRIEAEGRIAVDHELLAFLLPCYLAFQLGAWSMTADSLGDQPDEQTRAWQQSARYRSRLAALLSS
jgi:hypothetical protein